ncbi:MAG: YybH family protein [Gemmatimonadales bacterium]
MSSTLLRALALVTIGVTAACEDEPLSPAVGQSGMEQVAEPAVVVGSGKDRAAIREIVRTFDEAWTAGDPVRYAAQYAKADFVGPNGAVLDDPDAITALYTALFSFVFGNTTRRSTIRDLTFLSPRIAVLNIDTRVRGFESLPPGIVPWRPGVIRALEKNVLVKRGDTWHIVQHQQTLLAPEQ